MLPVEVLSDSGVSSQIHRSLCVAAAMLLNANDLSYYVCFLDVIQYCRRAHGQTLPGQECPKRVHPHKAANNFLPQKHK